MRPVVASLAALSFVAACTSSGAPGGPPREWFVDGTAAAGLDFVHVNGMSGAYYMAEIMAPGVALFDYDNDGDLDVYLVQGQPLDPSADGQRPREPGLSDRLFRNDLEERPDGTRTLHFTDVTRESRIEAQGYGMGVAAGDFDNDGWTDLYLTKFDAANQLLRNNGDGTFTDVAKASGTDHRSWSVSASFVDIDRDGWLDLYVTNYLRYSLASNPRCYNASGVPGYCTPDSFDGLADRLYRNKGNGTFADVSVSSGVAREQRPGLGVTAADFNRDGWVDIYVANDGRENLLWLNRGNGTFEDGALLAGVALPVTAKAEASMGVDAGDVDGDGDEDLLVTELGGEGSNLFVNDGSGVFEDRSAPSGVGPASLPLTGFGAAWVDVDRDGLLDVLSVNGAVQVIESLRQAGDPFPLRQRKQLLRNLGGGRFEEVTSRAGVRLRDVRGRTRRGVRRHRQRWGRRRTGGQQQRSGPVAPQPERHASTGSACGYWDHGGRDMLGARVEIARRPRARCGGARGPTAATPRRTIREWWRGWATRWSLPWSASPGRAARPKRGAACPSTGTRRSAKGAGVETGAPGRLRARAAPRARGVHGELRPWPRGAPCGPIRGAPGHPARPLERRRVRPGAHPWERRCPPSPRQPAGNSARHAGGGLRRHGETPAGGRVPRYGRSLLRQRGGPGARRHALAVFPRPRVSVQERSGEGRGSLREGGGAGTERRPGPGQAGRRAARAGTSRRGRADADPRARHRREERRGALRSWTRRPRQVRLRARGDPARGGPHPGSRRDGRPLPARARLPRPGQSGQGR